MLKRVETLIDREEGLMNNLSAIAQGLAQLQLSMDRLGKSPIKSDTERLPNNLHGLENGIASPTRVDHLHSKLCTMEQFMTESHRHWCDKMRQDLVWHRKQWEFCYILQSLHQLGLLMPGKTGLGFGVGSEPIPAVLARLGCRIVATDMVESDPSAEKWRATGQYVGNLEELNSKGICPPDQFRRLVSFRPVDMTAIPDDLVDFDFLWSACALEHLGSLAKGEEFVLQAMKCLKPGGVAVHTTEFNVSSDEQTFEDGSGVMYRKRDILRMQKQLTIAGHSVAPLDFNTGTGFLDNFVDYMPFRREPQPHLRLRLGGFTVTSIGLIIKKAG